MHIPAFLYQFNHFLDEFIKPNPKYALQGVEQHFDNLRKKGMVVLHIVLLVLVFIILFISEQAFNSALFVIGLLTVNLTALYLSCKKHPCIFKIHYTMLGLFYGLFCANTSMIEGMALAYIGVQVVQMFNYLLLRSLPYYFASVVIQTILLWFYYPQRMDQAFLRLSPQEFTGSMTLACSMHTVFMLSITVITDYFMKQAQYYTHVVERKKEEYEKQKTFYLSFSHELRNLINSLTGNIKLAGLEKLTPRARELFVNAEMCGELLLHLVNNILDTGKAEIGELEVTPVPTKIYETFERIWSVCAELMKRKGLNGTMKMKGDMPRTLVLDHYRLTQIMLNLVGNALKFTEKGSIDVSIELLNQQEIDDKCFAPFPFNESDDQDEGIFEKSKLFTVFNENMIVLTTNNTKVSYQNLKRPPYSDSAVLKVVVQDSGCGMNGDDIGKLFQKFSQLNYNTSTKQLGTGLGLFITKQLCHKMKGEVKAYSKPNRGSAFIFCIPVKCSHKEEDVFNSETMQSIISIKRFSAMIVDDIPFNHFILKNYLEKLQFDIIGIADDGLKAFQKYSESITKGNRPQILTMDLDMPIMNGKEASMKIRELEKQNNLKPTFLMIISGNCTESEIQECLDPNGKIQAQAFLKKPVSLDDLVRVISTNIRSLSQ